MQAAVADDHNSQNSENRMRRKRRRISVDGVPACAVEDVDGDEQPPVDVVKQALRFLETKQKKKLPKDKAMELECVKAMDRRFYSKVARDRILKYIITTRA